MRNINAKSLLLSCILLFLAIQVVALDIHGTITDNKTGLPLPGVLVRIVSADKEVGRATTNTSGAFSINLSYNTDYRVYIDLKGYEQVRLDISTKFSTQITSIPPLDIAMNPLPAKDAVKANIATPSTASTNSNATIVLRGKVYHMQLGGMGAEQVVVKNTGSGIIQTDNTISNGNYLLSLEAGQNYMVSVIGNGINPIYNYDSYFISTYGVSGSVIIIRNFENKAIIDVAESNTKTNTTPNKKEDVKSATNQREIKARNVEVRISDVNNSKPNKDSIRDYENQIKERALLEKEKAEAIQKAEALRKKNNDALVKKQYNDSIQKFQQDILAARKLQERLNAEKEREDNEKLLAQQKADEERKAKEAILAQERIDAEKKRLQAENNRRIDSVMASGTRFMHKEKTKEDIAKEQNNTLTTTTTNSNNRLQLPITVNESRTFIQNNTLYYGPGKAMLDDIAKAFLLDVANTLRADSTKQIDIVVHSDANEEASVADYICKLRIKQIIDLLVTTHQVNFSQLHVRSAGSDQGVNTCKKGDAGCTDLDHQLNRRVEFIWSN